MSIMTAKEVRDILLSQIPYLKSTNQIWLVDQSYVGIDPRIIENELTKLIDPSFKRVDGEKWDCDDIAVNGRVEVLKWWKNNYKESESVAMGVANGIRFNGVDENHTLNVLIFKNVVYLYDFQLDEWWQANPVNDLIYKVDM